MMKAVTRIVGALTGIVLLGLVLPAMAGDYAETAAALTGARKNMAQAEQGIGNAAGKVQAAVDRVKTARNFEGPHWGALDQAMQEWSAALESQSRVIDANARTILRLDPAAQVSLNAPAAPELKPLRDHMRQVRADLEAAVARAEQSKARQQALLGQVPQEMRDTVKDVAIEQLLDTANIPTDLEGAVSGKAKDMAVDAAVAAGKWIAKPLDLAAQGLTFTVRLYYMADQLQSAGRSLKSAQEVIAFADEFITKTHASIASAEQGIGIVERHLQARDTAVGKFWQTQGPWRKESEASTRQLVDDASRAIEQGLAKIGSSAIRVPYLPYSSRPVPPIEAGEYQTEAKDILRALQSAALAAVDGGAPLAFYDLRQDHLLKLDARFSAARQVYDPAYAAYGTAASQYWEAYSAAWARAIESGSLNWFEGFMAAMKPASDAMVAPANRLDQAVRELIRLNTLRGMVGDGANQLAQLIVTAGRAANGRHFNLAQGYGVRFQAALNDRRNALGEMPETWLLEAFERWADTAAGPWAAEQLNAGTPPGAVREVIFDQARQVRQAETMARRAWPGYQQATEAARLLAREAKSALIEYMDKYGPLMLSYSGIGTQAHIDSNIRYYKEYVEQWLVVGEPGGLVDPTRAQGFPYAATASRIESRLGEVDDVLGRIDTFRWRLSNTRAAMERVSQALTGKPLFSPRGNSAQLSVLEETTSGSWASFAAATRALATQDDALRAMVQQRYQVPSPFERVPPPQLLVWTQGALLEIAGSLLRNYTALRNAGVTVAFVPVHPVAYARVQKLWQGLKPLYAQHESLAAAQRARLDEAAQGLPDETGLDAAYTALPSFARPSIQRSYDRYRRESAWLREYLSLKRDLVRPLSDPKGNAALSELQSLIEGYSEARREWERQQAEAQAQSERQLQEARQRAEADDKLRREREQQAGQAGIESVRKLYQDFATTYQARNLRGLLRFMTPDWRAADGSDLRDLEDILDNSFRVFNSIVFAISGLNIVPAGEGRFTVTYSAAITGRINQMNLNHKETAQVEDTVILTPGGPRIQASRGGRIWLKQ